MEIARFIANWPDVQLPERSAAQQHFLDLCELVGHPTPAEAAATRNPASTPDMTDEGILEKVLDLNLQRADD